MAHDHHHHGESLRDYFTEQLLGIMVCSAIGFVAVRMYVNGSLKYILNEPFHLPVLIGGLAVLLIICLFRAISVWQEAGALQHADHDHGPECGQDHVHGPNCDHDHGNAYPGAPGHTHDHDHAGHSHDLSWVFVTMLILVIPVALYLCGMPNKNMQKLAVIAEAKLEGKDVTEIQQGGMNYAEMAKDATVLDERTLGNGVKTRVLQSASKLMFLEATAPDESPKYEEPGAYAELVKDAAVIESKKLDDGTTVRILQLAGSGVKIRETTPPPGKEMTPPKGKPKDPRKFSIQTDEGTPFRFNDLNDAAYDEGKRNSLQGQTAILEGRFTRISDKEFTLRRPKVTCCAADSVTLKVRIIVPQALSGFADYEWVKVKGVIQFFKVPNKEQYIPVIVVGDITDVQKGEPDNEYEL